MRYFYRIKNKQLFYFNSILIFLLLILLIYPFCSKTTVSKYNNYSISFTYYYPGDATGSTTTTASGKTVSDFTVGDNGWYFYNGYLVIAAATTNCRDSSNHCGISIEKHGMATSIHYYNLYDTLTLNIGGKNYNAMVLDSCGACMWSKRDSLGELFDIFSTKDGTNPSIYDNLSSIISNDGSVISDEIDYNKFFSQYKGDIKQGYIYLNQEYAALHPYKDNDNIIEQKINSVIGQIFKNTIENYVEYNGSDYDLIITGDPGNPVGWKQTDSKWGSIKLGNSNTSISQAGCLVTSVAIQIQRSGTKILTNNFNPGTFVQYISHNNGFYGDLFNWTGWQGIAPNWVYAGKFSLPSSKQDKIQKLSGWLNQGYYPVMCAKKNCGHWVAVTGVTNNDILISDPGSNSTSLFSKYGNIANDSTLKVGLFKKTD